MGQIAITGIFMITRLWFHDNALNAKKNNSENSKNLAIFFYWYNVLMNLNLSDFATQLVIP